MTTKRRVLDRLHGARRSLDALRDDDLRAVRSSNPLLRERLDALRADLSNAIALLDGRRGGTLH